MKSRILLLMLAMFCALNMTACTNKKDVSTEETNATVEKKDKIKNSDTEATTEDNQKASEKEDNQKISTTEKNNQKTSATDTKRSTSSDGTGKKIDKNETGNFKGLDTEEEISIDVNEGEKTVGE